MTEEVNLSKDDIKKAIDLAVKQSINDLEKILNGEEVYWWVGATCIAGPFKTFDEANRELQKNSINGKLLIEFWNSNNELTHAIDVSIQDVYIGPMQR